MQPNMTQTARAVQAQGRGKDSMLVHMSPREVRGLQALALANGGYLTINPQTGLPEAGFLEDLLPTLAGAALTIGSGGAIDPMTAAMIVGGGTTVATGDINKGLMAGLGAFGGAGMGTGLQSAGTAANAANAANVAAPDVLTAAGSNALEASAPALTPTQQFTTGLKSVFDTGETGKAARTAFMGNVGGYGGLATKAGMAAAPALLQMPTTPATKTEESNYEGPYTPTPREVRFPTPEQQAQLGTSEFTYFTPSNPVPGFQPFSATQTATAPRSDLIPEGQLGSGLQRFQPEFEEFLRSRMSQGFSRGGSVPMLEDGGFVLTKKAVDGLGRGSNKKGQENARRGLGAIPIKGPGTGTSDSIKTTIDGKRPALVSNGEAYVPKRQVAKRGGAKAFYALMNKAEKAADKRKRA